MKATQAADATLRLNRTLKVRILRLIRDLESDLSLLEVYSAETGVEVKGMQGCLEGLHAARHALEAGRKGGRSEGIMSRG